MTYDVTEVRRYIVKDGDRDIQFDDLDAVRAWYKRQHLKKLAVSAGDIPSTADEFIEFLEKLNLEALANELRAIDITVTPTRVDNQSQTVRGTVTVDASADLDVDDKKQKTADALVAEETEWLDAVRSTLDAKTSSKLGGVLDDPLTAQEWSREKRKAGIFERLAAKL